MMRPVRETWSTWGPQARLHLLAGGGHSSNILLQFRTSGSEERFA